MAGPAPDAAVDGPALDCATWQDYRAGTADTASGLNAVTADLGSLPQLPAGFEQGCLFSIDNSRSRSTNPSPIHILRNGISLEDGLGANALPSPVVSSQGSIPQVLLQDLPQGFLESSDVVTYRQTCALLNPSRSGDCATIPPYEAYILRQSSVWQNSVCFQNHCLQSAHFPPLELLSLWDSDLPEPALSAYGEDIPREQYSPRPLEAILAEISTPPAETASAPPGVAYSPEAIALQLFGRTALEEGQQPTVVASADTQSPVVTVTNFGELDDSVGGSRYRLEFETLDGNQYKLVWAGAQRYCRRTAPPQWTMELCP